MFFFFVRVYLDCWHGWLRCSFFLSGSTLIVGMNDSGSVRARREAGLNTPKRTAYRAMSTHRGGTPCSLFVSLGSSSVGVLSAACARRDGTSVPEQGNRDNRKRTVAATNGGLPLLTAVKSCLAALRLIENIVLVPQPECCLPLVFDPESTCPLRANVSLDGWHLTDSRHERPF